MGGINRLENHAAKIKQLAIHGGFFLFLFIICSGVATSSLAEQLNIGFSISTSAQRETFYTLAREFERHHPGVTVRFTTLSSEEYKRSFPSMVSADSNLDVLYWHSGQRLFDYVDEGLVLSIDDVWERQDLEAVFDQSVKNTLIRDGQYYGVPISYYQIGFYYSKNIFNHLSLTEPSSWQDLMVVCEAIKQAGYPPIFIGTKSNWPATAWFDYLNLRINGLDFHQKLTRGEIPFTDERVVSVFNTLLEPIEKGYFISDHNELLWREGLPFLFRDLVGMSMIGNYVIQDIQQTMVPRLGFFPFPILDERVAPYEEAPIDVLIIPKQASNVSLAKQFLAFSARHEVQSSLNKSLGVLSPHKLAQQDTSPLTKEAYDVLSNAAGVSHFFDRDAIEIFANGVMPVLDKFMREPDVDSTVRELEKIRKTTFVTH